MRTLTLMLAQALFLSYSSLSQDIYAKVNTLDGKEMYILNEPVKSYEVVAEVKTGLKITSLLTRGLYNEDIHDKVAQFSRRAERKLSKKGTEFDALLYKEGRSAQAIRFTEEKSEKTDGLAIITQYNGVHTFVLANPVKDYQVETSVRGTIKFLPLLTYGFFNHTIAHVERIRLRAEACGFVQTSVI